MFRLETKGSRMCRTSQHRPSFLPVWLCGWKAWVFILWKSSFVASAERSSGQQSRSSICAPATYVLIASAKPTRPRSMATNRTRPINASTDRSRLLYWSLVPGDSSTFRLFNGSVCANCMDRIFLDKMIVAMLVQKISVFRNPRKRTSRTQKQVTRLSWNISLQSTPSYYYVTSILMSYIYSYIFQVVSSLRFPDASVAYIHASLYERSED